MADNSIPVTQLGVLSTSDTATLQTFPVPYPRPGEVLIQNVAVAANPKDWKMPFFTRNYSAIEGNDVAGIIVKVGEGVTEYKGGERVAAFSKMRTQDNKYGAYAQYTVAPASTTFIIPESTSFEEAATLPLAVMTAAIGFFKHLGIPDQPTRLFVIGVAGSSKDYAESLGVDMIIDYREHDGDTLESALIEASTGHNVQYAYNAIAENNSTSLLCRVLSKVSPGGKGKFDYLLVLGGDELNQVPEGIDATRTYVATAYGEDEEFAALYYRHIGQWLATTPSKPTPFKPNRVKLMPEGLASVPKGLELLKADQVYGEKLVYRIADTPGLK